MLSLINWIYSKIFNTKLKAKILIIGLDNAGKTTLVNILKNNKVGIYLPTNNARMEVIDINAITLHIYDLGGHRSTRRLWQDYCINIDAIIFIIDVADMSRIKEATSEFNKILMTEGIESTPILVLGNKVDLGYALSEEELRKSLLTQFYSNDIKIEMCSIIKRWGINDGISWLTKKIQEKSY